MDINLFHLINNLAGQSKMLDAIGIFSASWLIWVMVAGVVLLAFQKGIKLLVNVFFASVFAYATNYIISFFYFRSRPFVVLENVHKLIEKNGLEKSFPSDHAALAFAIAISVFLVNKKLGIVFILAAVIVALGRVYVGVHYLSDVLAGAVIGSIFGFIISKVSPNKLTS